MEVVILTCMSDGGVLVVVVIEVTIAGLKTMRRSIPFWWRMNTVNRRPRSSWVVGRRIYVSYGCVTYLNCVEHHDFVDIL